jgi:DNA modification methylase
MEFKKIPINKLIPASYNPRKKLKPGDKEFEKIKNSIQEFGYVDPVIVNKDMTVIGGHQRVTVLKTLGYTEIDCVIIDIDKTKEKALNIALNKISGEWDKELLADLIKDLQSQDFDIEFTGFEPPEIDELFSQVHSKDVDEDDFDIDEELNNEEEPIAKVGDIWLLGIHRLLCGDATNPDDIKKLMNGNKANVCITDPPYNCDYEGGTGLKIQNDNMSNAAFKEFLLKSFSNIYEHLVDGGAFYCFHSDAEKVNFHTAMIEAGFHYSTTCIWVKNSLVLGRMDFQMRHEPILYGWKPTAKHKWYGGRKLTTVWEFKRPIRSELHPTCKPLDLIGFPITSSTLENSIIIDPFGGSGSTLISAEQLNRICYTSELDPKYATVIIKRFINQVGTDEEVFVVREGKKIKYSDIQIQEGVNKNE